MTIDLQNTLADLAGSVSDDALTARLTAQVGPMVGRIKRRRAARAAAAGTVSMGTVAAVTVGAVAFANRGGGPTTAPAGQASQQATPVTHDGSPLDCGDTVPKTLTSDSALALAGEVPSSAAYGGELLTNLRWWAPGNQEVSYAQARVDVAVTQGGRVVGVAFSDWPVDATANEVSLGTTQTGTVGAFASALPVTPCGGDTPLGAGDYQVLATVTLTSGGGDVWRASTGPWPLTIADVTDPAADAEAEAAVQEIIAASPQVSMEQPFGTCGTAVPALADDDPLTLELDLDSGSGMLYASGDPIDGVTILLPGDGNTSVLANVPESGATVVLARDGVVVGRAQPLEDVPMLLETTPEAQVLYGTGAAELCSLPGADAPELDLPVGIYQAYAVLPASLTEVTDADGATSPVSEDIVVRSKPVDVIVQAPRE